MKNRITLFFAATLIAVGIQAKPAYRGTIEKQMPDGTVQEVYLHGDEHFHYLTDSEGNWLKQENGSLVRTEPLTNQQIESRRMASRYRISQDSQLNNGAYLAPRGLVILANFSDVQFQAENTREAFDSLMNVKGYTFHGVTNSVRDYFIDQSRGQYAPTFDVVGPVTVNHAMAYYGANDQYGYDKNAEQLIVDACKAAKQDCNVDFSQYDSDNDGYVDFVFVFYAGYGEADGADENTIWQHMYKLYSYARINCTLDGVKVNLYACGSELAYHNRRKTTNPRDGISTCCHEFSHVCGLPDMYDTSDSEANTLGSWDLMDNGTYNNNGWTPPCYSAYERFFCGWLTPTLLNSDCNITLPELSSTNAACIITSSGEHNLDGTKPSPADFYLLENRQQHGWDEYLPGHGLLITRIQYKSTSWNNNQVNSGTNQRVAIQPADGKLSILGDSGDTYPGKKGTDEFTSITSYPITEINESNEIITFKFMNGGQNILLNTPINEQPQFSIIKTDAGLLISNANEGQQINIYDLNGALIDSRKAVADNCLVPITNKGTYVVQVGTAAKVIRL